MDETQIKHVIEAALLAAGKPLPFEKLASLFATKAAELDKETLKSALDALAEDYRERGLELKEVASGYRIQVKRSMSDWLTPLWEERAPRYTRALLETLALIAYRQPITRAEIEEVRGVTVSTNIIRTLLERNWVRVVGHRDVPGKPEMFGTTKDFLDYFGLTKLGDLPPLADIKDGLPELSPQTDLIDVLGGEEQTPLPEQSEETEAAASTDEPAADGGEVAAVIAHASVSMESDEEDSDEMASSMSDETAAEADPAQADYTDVEEVDDGTDEFADTDGPVVYEGDGSAVEPQDSSGDHDEPEDVATAAELDAPQNAGQDDDAENLDEQLPKASAS